MTQKASIDPEKCISCGACVYQCPFGAISDKSYITQAAKLLRESEGNKKYRVYGVIAPSVAGQYADVDVGRVMAGILQLGFYYLVEAAWGADFVAYLEGGGAGGEEVPDLVVLPGVRVVHREELSPRWSATSRPTSRRWRTWRC